MRKFIISAFGQEFAVEVALDSGGRYLVSVDGNDYALDARWLEGAAGRALSLIREGRVHTVDLSNGELRPWVHLDGVVSSAKTVGADRYLLGKTAAGGTAGGGDGVVTAPISGRVVRCLVKPEDQVQTGQPLVILEAMKMENELRASCSGRVVDVSVDEGQAVETGEQLLTISN